MIGFTDKSSFYDPMLSGDNSQYRLIILDDDALFCSLIESIARRKKICILAFQNPLDFLAAVEENHPDAVLVDLNLQHEMDGIDVVSQLDHQFPRMLISCEDPWNARTHGYKKISTYLKNNEDLQFVHKNQGPRFILSNIVRLIRSQSLSSATRIA